MANGESSREWNLMNEYACIMSVRQEKLKKEKNENSEDKEGPDT